MFDPYHALRALIRRSRKKKFELFMKGVRPVPTDTILDAGAGFYGIRRLDNFLEEWYPYPKQITALDCTLEGVDRFRSRHPSVQLICADGLTLPFQDNTFDIGFSNAVIEHVGERVRQEVYVQEIIRVCKKIFVITPDRHFPVDIHMLVPFAHWLPRTLQPLALRPFKREAMADVRILNLLDFKEFKCLFPAFLKPRFERIRLLGLGYGMSAIVDKLN